MTARQAKELAAIAAVLLFVLALVGGAIWWNVASWRECRRIHPWWYCARGGK